MAVARKRADRMYQMALKSTRELSKDIDRLADSINRLSASVFLPKAQNALVSLVLRYKKQRKIESWDEFEECLPEEPRNDFKKVVKSIVLSKYRAFANPVLTWEAIEALVLTYLPGGKNLVQFLKAEMKKKKCPLS
jgi:hypothetical protein